jgi:hypothetical protein
MMNTQPNRRVTPLRPEDALPDQIDHAEIGGVTVRKGTVAAFLQNAIQWSDPETPDADRDAFAHEIAGAVPALRALSVFTVFTVRDERLRALMDGH